MTGGVVLGLLRTKREQMVEMEERLERARTALREVRWLARSRRADGGLSSSRVAEIRRWASSWDEDAA